jgi:hypothetical protein
MAKKKAVPQEHQIRAAANSCKKETHQEKILLKTRTSILLIL